MQLTDSSDTTPVSARDIKHCLSYVYLHDLHATDRLCRGQVLIRTRYEMKGHGTQRPAGRSVGSSRNPL